MQGWCLFMLTDALAQGYDNCIESLPIEESRQDESPDRGNGR